MLYLYGMNYIIDVMIFVICINFLIMNTHFYTVKIIIYHRNYYSKIMSSERTLGLKGLMSVDKSLLMNV